MRGALLAALLLGLAGSASGQAWLPPVTAPGGEVATYRFTGSTDSDALELAKECRAIVFGFDQDVGGTQTTATADLLACPTKTAVGVSCQKVADLDADVPGTTANPAYRNIRCDVQTAPTGGVTAACYVGCAAQSAGTGSGGGVPGPPGASDADELTYTPGGSAGTQWDALCDGELVFTADYLDCNADVLTELIANTIYVSTGVDPPVGTADSPNGKPVMHFEVDAGVLQGVFAAPDGGSFTRIGPDFATDGGHLRPVEPATPYYWGTTTGDTSTAAGIRIKPATSEVWATGGFGFPPSAAKWHAHEFGFATSTSGELDTATGTCFLRAGSSSGNALQVFNGSSDYPYCAFQIDDGDQIKFGVYSFRLNVVGGIAVTTDSVPIHLIGCTGQPATTASGSGCTSIAVLCTLTSASAQGSTPCSGHLGAVPTASTAIAADTYDFWMVGTIGATIADVGDNAQIGMIGWIESIQGATLPSFE